MRNVHQRWQTGLPRTEESYKQGIAAMHEAYKKADRPLNSLQKILLCLLLNGWTRAWRVSVSSGWTAMQLWQHASRYVSSSMKGPDGKQYSDPDHLN